MALLESMDLISSVLDGDLSFWSYNEPKNGTPLDPFQLPDILTSSDHLSLVTEGLEGCQDDPLPDWMSEKVQVFNLSALEDGQMDDFDAFSLQEDILSCHNVVVDSEDNTIPIHLSFHDYPSERYLFADSPTSSLGSDGTAANSGVTSPFPSSPCNNSIQFEPDSLYSTQECNTSPPSQYNNTLDFEPTQENSTVDADSLTVNVDSLDLLLNPSAGNINEILQDPPSLPLQLHLSIPKEEDLELIKEKIGVIIQSEGDVMKSGQASKTGGKVRSKLKTKERKERKKGQNKEAATRYRNKKKKEVESLSSEMDTLEGKNDTLRSKVDSLEQEIKYLENLMLEIYKVKGQIQIMKLS